MNNKGPNYIVTIIVELDKSITIVPKNNPGIKVEVNDTIQFLVVCMSASEQEFTIDFSAQHWDGIIKGPRKLSLNTHHNRSASITVLDTSQGQSFEYFVIKSDATSITPTPTMIIRGGPSSDD